MRYQIHIQEKTAPPISGQNFDAKIELGLLGALTPPTPKRNTKVNDYGEGS